MNEHSPITVTESGTTCVGKTAIVDTIKTALEAANLNVVIDEHLINELPLRQSEANAAIRQRLADGKTKIMLVEQNVRPEPKKPTQAWYTSV